MNQLQETFDFDRRDRMAARTDDALRDMGVPEGQRAVIWLMITHPACDVDSDRKASLLWISYRSAASHVAASGRYQCRLAHSNLARATKPWIDRGILHVVADPDRHVTRWVCDFRALAEWADQRQQAYQLSAGDWLPDQGVTSCDPVCPPVTSCDPVCPPVTRCDLSKKEGRITDNSFIPSQGTAGHTGARQPDLGLPPLPDVVYRQQVTNRVLYDQIRSWWQDHQLHRRFDPDQVMGAILAARDVGANNAQRYVTACLARGVEPTYVQRAIAFRAECRRDAPYAPHGVTR